MNELVKLFKDYIEFLNEANEEPIRIAAAHGWKCSVEHISKGVEFREKIDSLIDETRIVRRDYSAREFNWNEPKNKLPLAVESGNWDGRRSDLVMAQMSDGSLCLARIYQGKMDGSKFCDWYDNRDYGIEEPLLWCEVPEFHQIVPRKQPSIEKTREAAETIFEKHFYRKITEPFPEGIPMSNERDPLKERVIAAMLDFAQSTDTRKFTKEENEVVEILKAFIANPEGCL